MSNKIESEFFKKFESYNIKFNPSIYVDDNVDIYISRVWNEKNIESILILDNKEINLSSYVKKFDIQRCSDPKIFKFNQEIYITFNNGFVKEGNDLYILKIFPHLGIPKICKYFNRKIIEKNWGFFECKGELFCLYNISGLKILKLDKESDASLEFVDFYENKKINETNLSIGSQPVIDNNRLYLMAHKKKFFFKRRLYTGRLCSISLKGLDSNCDIKDNELFKIEKPIYIDSLSSLLGSREKFNKNLISCTYFSSLIKYNDSLYVGYGINDRKAAFKNLKDSK